jgi:hypothetical protein
MLGLVGGETSDEIRWNDFFGGEELDCWRWWSIRPGVEIFSPDSFSPTL